MKNESKAFASRRNPTWTITAAKIALVVLVIILANIGASWLIDRFQIQVWPEHLEIVDRAVLIGVVLYIALMAIPFLPGIEIGLALMIVLGPKGIVLTYVCTLLALTISFCLGRLVPADLLIGFLRWLHLGRAAELVEKFDALPPESRLEFLFDKAPTRAVPTLLKRRYLVLALLLNLPGNALIGGGGGIGMMAGMSRLFSIPMYCALISVAILPGPVLVMLSTLAR